MQVEHKYFADNYFDAFELKPDSNTTRSIQQFGLLTKKIQNTWYLFYQSEGPRKTDPELLVNKEFTFIFNINDSGFEQYTNSDLVPKPNAIQFYAATIDNKFFSSSRFIEQAKFDYSIQHTDRPVNIKLKKFKGEVLKDIAVVEPAVKQYSFDVSATGEQPYDISENTLPITDERKREIFVFKNYFKDRFYGMIYFKVFPSTGDASNRYNLVFDKK
jgi:hypothetical protein